MKLDVFDIPGNTQKVAVYFRNGWQLWPGIGGNFKTEWVATLLRNTHLHILVRIKGYFPALEKAVEHIFL